MKLFKLFGAIFSVSVRRELAFRTDLLVRLLASAVGIGAGLAALAVVYTQTETLAGWRLGEAIVLLGTYQIVSGVLTTFIEPNVVWFAGQVKSGKLDEVLLKPVSSIFLVSLGSCSPLGLLDVALGVAVLGLGLRELGDAPTPWGFIGWLVLLAVAIAVTWASRVLLATVALWSPGLELDVVYGALWQFGRYPVGIYRQPVRFILTYVLPVAFISTFPARVLTGSAGAELLVVGAVVGIGAVVLVRLVWNDGLRRYTSATS